MSEVTDSQDAGGEGAIDDPVAAMPVEPAGSAPAARPAHEDDDELSDETVDGQVLDWVEPGEETDPSEFDGGSPMDAIRALFGRGKLK